MSLVRSKPAVPARRAQPPREERVRGAFAKLPVGLAVATPDGHWLFVNERFRTLIGYTHSELARITLHGVTHPDDARSDLALMKRLAAREIDHYRIQKRVMAKNGRYRLLEVLTAIVEDMLVYVVDEPQPSILDDINGVAIIRTDSRGVVTGWNAGAEAIFGYSRAEIVGKNRRVLYRDSDGWSGKSTDILNSAAAGKLSMEDWRVRKGGAHIWVHCTLSAFENGGTTGYVETITAPSEPLDQLRAELEKRKRTEESLREAFADIGRTSEETMNELRIMTAALRDEIDRRKAAEEELRKVSARLAAPPPAPPPSSIAEVEEITVSAPPPRKWKSFAETAPAEVLRQCAEGERSGTLLVRHDGQGSDGREKEIFFENGRLFSCASNDPSKFLAERMVAAGTITEVQRQKALEIKQASQLALGRILLILGAIDETQLVAAMRRKLDDEIGELLGWSDGRYVFVEGEVPSLQLVPLRVDVDVFLAPQVVYIASTKSGKVHNLGCMSAKRISAAARVEVKTTDGFELCRQCFR